MDAIEHGTTGPSVLFITRKWGPRVGGMETWSESLAERLARHLPVEVVALPSRDQEHGPTLQSMLSFGARAAIRVLSGPLPEVVHVGDLALWPIAALASTRRRTFVSVHGSDVAYSRVNTPAGRAYRRYLQAGSHLLGSVGLIPNSRATANLLRVCGLDSELPILLAVEPPGDAPDEVAGGDVVGRPFLLFTGRLTEPKGLSWFVDNVLGRLSGEIELKVAGSRWDISEERALAHPRVDFLGPQSPAELRSLRRDAVAVVVPNRATVSDGGIPFEGFGLVAVEAAADGGVVVASDVHGLQDAVLDGVTGFRLDPDNVDAWVDKLAAVRGWPDARREQFVRKATDAVAQCYSWDRYLEQLLSVYRSRTHDLEASRKHNRSIDTHG